jgi:hypothetical protein
LKAAGRFCSLFPFHFFFLDVYPQPDLFAGDPAFVKFSCLCPRSAFGVFFRKGFCPDFGVDVSGAFPFGLKSHALLQTVVLFLPTRLFLRFPLRRAESTDDWGLM